MSPSLFLRLEIPATIDSVFCVYPDSILYNHASSQWHHWRGWFWKTKQKQDIVTKMSFQCTGRLSQIHV